MRVWSGSERTMERTGGTRTDASFGKHADEMQMMTWQNATLKHMTWQQRKMTGGHLVHQIRGVTALEREDPALHEGNKKVRGHEALRLLEHPESANGGRRVRRHRLWFAPPGGPSPGGGASLVGRQVDEVDCRVDVLNVEIRLLPQFHRL